MINRVFSFIGTLALLTACSYNMPETSMPGDRIGSDDFSRFYVLGDGFSSGMMNGVLTSETQEYAYPNVIGNRIDAYFEADLFQQADVTTPLGLNQFEPENGESGQYRLFFRSPGDPIPGRRTGEGEAPGEWQGDLTSLRDLSIPGIRSFEVDEAVNSIDNRYLNRLPIQADQSLLDHLVGQDPAIILVSLGYDDIIPFILSGGTGSTVNNSVGEMDATPLDIYSSAIERVTDRLLDETDASLIVTTIPDPRNTPLVTTLKYHMDLGRNITAGDIGRLRGFYSEFNERAYEYNLADSVTEETRRPFIDFDVDGGADFKKRVIYDPTLIDVEFDDGYVLPKIRQMDSSERLIYKSEEMLFENYELGKTEPIQPEYVLDASEIARTGDLLSGYNNAIRAIAGGSSRINLLDISQLMENLSNGEVQVDGVFYNDDFERESLFSADGIFLNPKGHAMVARKLAELLNQQYDVPLTEIDVNNKPGLSFDQDF
mgnify:CR=1 FL=1